MVSNSLLAWTGWDVKPCNFASQPLLNWSGSCCPVHCTQNMVSMLCVVDSFGWCHLPYAKEMLQVSGMVIWYVLLAYDNGEPDQHWWEWRLLGKLLWRWPGMLCSWWFCHLWCLDSCDWRYCGTTKLPNSYGTGTVEVSVLSGIVITNLWCSIFMVLPSGTADTEF